jgi:PHD/YefM family antitoxin component YafN of YafNO toxin-antitoxin module
MWLDDKRTALYRLYDADGVLLYIGISHDPETRFGQHSKLKEWWPLVARREVQWFDDLPSAATAEAEAIRGEDPEHNGTYSPRRDLRTIRDVVAADGVREVSLSLARPKLTGIVRTVAHTSEPVALLSYGQRYAVVVSLDFYERALAALGEERVPAEQPEA